MKEEKVDEDELTIEQMQPLEPGEQVEKWSDVYALRSRLYADLGNNETAGCNAALVISDMAWRLGSFPTMEDFEVMLDFIEMQKSPVAAWKLGNLINRQRAIFKSVQFKSGDRGMYLSRSAKTNPEGLEAEHESRVMRIIHACCRVCLYAGFPDSCEQIIEKMEEYERVPEPELLQEIADYRAEGFPTPEGVKESVMATVSGPRPVAEEILEEDSAEIVEPEQSPISVEDEDESLEGFGAADQMEAGDQNDVVDAAFGKTDEQRAATSTVEI